MTDSRAGLAVPHTETDRERERWQRWTCKAKRDKK